MDEARSETLVPASVEEAWDAVTDPERLEEWLGDDVDIELEPGGDVVVRTGDEERTGFVEEVSEPERLVFWWGTEETESSRVAIDLVPVDGGTIVRVVEERPLAVLGEATDPAPQMLAVA